MAGSLLYTVPFLTLWPPSLGQDTELSSEKHLQADHGGFMSWYLWIPWTEAGGGEDRGGMFRQLPGEEGIVLPHPQIHRAGGGEGNHRPVALSFCIVNVWPGSTKSATANIGILLFLRRRLSPRGLNTPVPGGSGEQAQGDPEARVEVRQL